MIARVGDAAASSEDDSEQLDAGECLARDDFGQE